QGGWYYGGAIFELPASGSIQVLASFQQHGCNPMGQLIMDASGNLYGTTEAGGSSNQGGIFELSHGSSSIAYLSSFNGTDGAAPMAGLTMDSSGDLYGTSSSGGEGYGTIFELAAGTSTPVVLDCLDGTCGSAAWSSCA